ncbi:alpha/beta fold hydrolase [Microcoleus sp. B7-D4]|uniref:alpha/beta fold hydrolase n=1 Tax=Microcoleus sp. B7-D4 TaxID=2818696 RepID=UPI002FD11DE3
MSKSLIAFGIVLAVAYSAACVFLFVAQGKFIFFPARAIETTPDAFQLKYQDVWLPISTKTGAVDSVHGWWIPASENPPSPPLLRGGARKGEAVPSVNTVNTGDSDTPPSPPLPRGGARKGEAVPSPSVNTPDLDTPPSPPLPRGGARGVGTSPQSERPAVAPVPPLNKGGLGAGLFDSHQKRGFCRGSAPVPTPATNHRMGVSGKKGRHGGTAPTKNETALGLGKVVLYLHGNASNVGANVEHAYRFHGLGLSVFVMDYRGYGKSQGDFPSESQVYEDAQLAWDYLVKQRGINPNQIYLYGHSLGGAIAIDLAVRHPEAAGVIVEGSFTSTRAMVNFQKGLFWMFPIDFLLTQRFDSLSKVDRLQMPVLFIHGAADNVVPVEMTKKLFDAAPEPKQLYIVPDGGHTNVAHIGGAEYLQILSQFLGSSQ